MTSQEELIAIRKAAQAHTAATEEGGQAAGVWNAVMLLERVFRELKITNAHLAILTGEEIASVED